MVKKELGLTAKRYKISFWGGGHVLELAVIVAQDCEYDKNH